MIKIPGFDKDDCSKHNLVRPDKNERFVLKKCLKYLKRHLIRYRHLNKETLEMICWTLGPEMERIEEFLFEQLNTDIKEKFDEELIDADFDPDLYADAVARVLRKVGPHTAKKVHHYMLKLIGSKYLQIGYRGTSEVEKNVNALQKMFNFTDQEIEFCIFLFIVSSYDAAESFFSTHLECNKFSNQKYLLNILEFSRKELSRVLSGTLKKISLYEMDNYNLGLEDDFLHLFQNPGDQSFSKNFFNKIPSKIVPLEYFFIKEGERNHILGLLKQKQKTSTNILLYGPPGTGKTSFSYSLANYLNLPAYEIVRGDENTAQNRRAAILACLNMTNSSHGSIIVVDEADNLLNTQDSWFSRGETQDKGWLNELLEKTGTRMIWITNRISGIEDSVLRRFAYSLHFKSFNRRQRTQLWENIIKQNKCKRFFAHADIEIFAKKHKLNAGIIDLAVKKALETESPSKTEFHQTVETALQAHETLLNNGERLPSKDQIEKSYSLAGLNVEGDIQAMLSQLEAFDNYLRNENQSKIMNMNLLLYGPPGTGKSELARYIANQLDREIICKRISDLQSMYVGEGEKNIKRAFIEAENEEAILIIDEADSLLFSRDRAKHSWEISFTNEFLTQMEKFRGILVCTTNRIDDLDAASFRRFNHKIGFDYLTPEGNTIFYRLFLEPLTRETLDHAGNKKIRRLNNLAPGDFKVVRDRYSFYPKNEINHKVLIGALEAEADLKNNHSNEKLIGF